MFLKINTSWQVCLNTGVLSSAVIRFFWGCPQAIARGRAFRSYSGTKANAQSLTGVSASIPHPPVQHAASFAGRLYSDCCKRQNNTAELKVPQSGGATIGYKSKCI